MNGIRGEQPQNQPQYQNGNLVDRRARREEHPDLFRRTENLAMLHVVMGARPLQNANNINIEAL